FELSSFLYWSNRVPNNAFFSAMVLLLALSAVLFGGRLNQVLQRLGAMLPDEGLRMEIRQFTALNLNLLLSTFLLCIVYVGLSHLKTFPLWLAAVLMVINRESFWFLIPLVLLPLAMTMALLWKTKEVILDNVFGAPN